MKLMAADLIIFQHLWELKRLLPFMSMWMVGKKVLRALGRGLISPAAAVKYIRRVEELIEVPVSLLSTSPEREDTITVRDPFAS